MTIWGPATFGGLATIRGAVPPLPPKRGTANGSKTCAPDGGFAGRGRSEGHRHRDGGTGNTGVEAAVIADREHNTVLDVPVAVQGYRRTRQSPRQTSAGVDGHRRRWRLKTRHLDRVINVTRSR